jgi:hypothetical protein
MGLGSGSERQPGTPRLYAPAQTRRIAVAEEAALVFATERGWQIDSRISALRSLFCGGPPSESRRLADECNRLARMGARSCAGCVRKAITNRKSREQNLSLGTPGAFQKLAVQVMREDGEILGYLKMPLTEAAGDRLRHEATILQKLRAFPQLRGRIPDLLYSGNWNETYVLFQTPLAGKAGPVYFTKLHTEFLETLHSCKPEILPGTAVFQEVAREWEQSVPHMGSSWQALGREALKTASHEMRRAEVRCGIQHGDFAPWNTRVHGGGLFLFDWEGAAWSAPALWDRFHFLAQTESLLNTRHPGRNGSADFRKQNRGTYILYLLHSAVKLSEESENSAGVEYRKMQLEKYMRSNTVTSAAD